MQPIPDPVAEQPAPVKKPKRFFASLRFNGLRYLVLVGALLSAWGLIRAAIVQTAIQASDGRLPLVIRPL